EARRRDGAPRVLARTLARVGDELRVRLRLAVEQVARPGSPALGLVHGGAALLVLAGAEVEEVRQRAPRASGRLRQRAAADAERGGRPGGLGLGARAPPGRASLLELRLRGGARGVQLARGSLEPRRELARSEPESPGSSAFLAGRLDRRVERRPRPSRVVEDA